MSTRTPRLTERRQRGGGSSSPRHAPATPRSPSLSSRSAATKGDSMADIKRRHADAKKRATLADGTPPLLRRAQELDQQIEGMPHWLKSHNVPDRWRQEVLARLEPISSDALTCREELAMAWGLLQSPSESFGLVEYERRYRRLERILGVLGHVVVDIEERFRGGEAWAACKCIQDWFRRRLTRRGFYTKRLHIHRRHRGLVPGIFDAIPAKSKLTVHRRTGAVTLEYPISNVERGFMD